MPYKIVDDKEHEIVWGDGEPVDRAVVGGDTRVRALTTCFKLLFPNEFERMKGDADVLYVTAIRAEADEPLTVDYTTAKKMDD